MKVIGDTARLMIDYLKAYVAEGGYQPKGESGRLLETAFKNEAFQTWINAYAEFIPEFQGKLKKILMNLSLPTEDEHLSIFQRGLLSAANMDKLEMFESRLKRALALPFDEYMKLALKYLPEGTEIDVSVYITLDPFNTGMTGPGKVFFSIFMVEPTPEICSGLAHEFHHLGAKYWLEKNMKLEALKNSHEYGRILASLFTYLVTEGLANWYTSPMAISVVEGLEGAEAHNKAVRKLEKDKPKLLRHLQKLLRWICEKHQPIEEVKDAFNKLSLDMSGTGLPPGHFLSGHMVRIMDENPNIEKRRIVNLVKNPFDFFDLYNIAAEEKEKLDSSLLKQLKSTIDKWSGQICE